MPDYPIRDKNAHDTRILSQFNCVDITESYDCQG